MENTTEVEYISIYDKPERARGMPKLVHYQMKKKRQRKIEIAKRCYNNNLEYVRLEKIICLDKTYKQRAETI